MEAEERRLRQRKAREEFAKMLEVSYLHFGISAVKLVTVFSKRRQIVCIVTTNKSL